MRMSQVRILYGPHMNVPNVQVLPGKAQKYIVVSILSDSDTVQSLWGNPDAEWHKDIFDEIKEAGFSVDEVYGGGRIYVDSDQKQIFIWGTSDRYGTAPRPLVEELLEAEFPDYSLKFNQEPK